MSAERPLNGGYAAAAAVGPAQIPAHASTVTVKQEPAVAAAVVVDVKFVGNGGPPGASPLAAQRLPNATAAPAPPQLARMAPIELQCDGTVLVWAPCARAERVLTSALGLSSPRRVRWTIMT